MKSGKIAAFTLIGILTVLSLSGCTDKSAGKDTVKLDPDNPVTLKVWHYYNGAQQAAFDELVTEFNSTVGREQGIYVEGSSRGSVMDLEEELGDAAAGKPGSDPLPDIFSTYSDTAYAIQQEGLLTDLTQYFSAEELSAYVEPYIEEGYFNNDGALYLLPVAKSTEIMMINATDWAPFAQAAGVDYSDLQTIEGVTAVAKLYYEWTDAQTPDIANDGKAFYGRDSMSNYFIIGMKQMGVDIFSVKDNEATICADKTLIRRLWDNYYVPYVRGYFASLGKFRSDDVKTGDLLAYTGSSSSAMYFPDAVMTDDEIREIDYVVLPAPIMEGGTHINVQQGAGMAVTKSDREHEYAACVFLKWFTRKENNMRFVCESAYLPVTREANTVAALDETIATQNLTVNSKAYDCLVSILTDFDNTKFYSPACFKNGYVTRKVLDYNLSDKAVADRALIVEAIEGGADPETVIADYISDDAFNAWYDGFCSTLDAKLNS